MITADQEIFPMSLCESEVSIPEAIAKISYNFHTQKESQNVGGK